MEEKETKRERQRQEDQVEKQMIDWFISKNSEIDRVDKDMKREMQRMYE